MPEQHSPSAEDELVEPLLFRLPPELRNDIYRLVLPLDQSFEMRCPLAQPWPPEPPLLRTNCQIRNEAISIYYKENEWIFCITNFFALDYLAWSKKSPWRAMANIRWVFQISFSSQYVAHRTWPYLRRWLQSHYQGGCLGIEMSDIKTKDTFAGHCLTVAAHIFEMTRNMRDDQGLYWPQIEPLLENAYLALAAENIS